MTNSLSLKEELLSPHTSIGLMLNSILAFPHKGETSGSMKERLVEELMPWFESKLSEAKQEAYEEVYNSMLSAHNKILKTNKSDGKFLEGHGFAVLSIRELMLKFLTPKS